MKKYHAICERCWKPFNEWYVIDGEASICSEECLNEKYTEKEIEEMELWEDKSENYRTSREDEDDMFYDEDGNLIEEEPDADGLRDLLLQYEIATEDELQLITNINWYSEETLLDVLYAKTWYRTRNQFQSEL